MISSQIAETGLEIVSRQVGRVVEFFTKKIPARDFREGPGWS
jgi:hypothetical protein